MTPFKKAQILGLVVLVGCTSGYHKNSASAVNDTTRIDKGLPVPNTPTKADKNLLLFDYKLLSKQQLPFSRIEIKYGNAIHEKDIIVNQDTVKYMVFILNKEYVIKEYSYYCDTNDSLEMHYSPGTIEVLGQKIILDTPVFDDYHYHINIDAAYLINLMKNKFIILEGEVIKGGPGFPDYYWMVFEISDRKHIKKCVLVTNDTCTNAPLCFGDFSGEGKLQFLPRYTLDTMLYPLTYINDRFVKDTSHLLILKYSDSVANYPYPVPPDLIDIKRSKWFFKLN